MLLVHHHTRVGSFPRVRSGGAGPEYVSELGISVDVLVFEFLRGISIWELYACSWSIFGTYL